MQMRKFYESFIHNWKEGNILSMDKRIVEIKMYLNIICYFFFIRMPKSEYPDIC